MNTNSRKISRFLLNTIHKHTFPLDYSPTIDFVSPRSRPWISFAVDSKITRKPPAGGGALPDFLTQLWANRGAPWWQPANQNALLLFIVLFENFLFTTPQYCSCVTYGAYDKLP